MKIFLTKMKKFPDGGEPNSHAIIQSQFNGEEYKEERKETHEAVKVEIIWGWVLFFLTGHVCAIYGLYLLLFQQTKLYTSLFALVLWILSAIGITGGVHRLWSHNSYKAKWPLRVLLMLMYTMTFEDYILEWCINHRIHHKYLDTNSDPYNSKRGFFFAHIGWLMVRRHPDYFEKRRKVIRSDLKNDPVVMFQKRSITPHENGIISLLIAGEGWHNYHHVFPWDYKAAELGNYRANLATAFIDFFSLIGWAYDLKIASNDLILKRVKRTGDGTHPVAEDNTHPDEDGIWGWDDSNLPSEDRKLATVINKKDH